MRTVEVLQTALRLAERAGYQIRHEWLDGNGGGACEVRGRKLLFVDLALGPREQLEVVLNALRQDPSVRHEVLSWDANLPTRRNVA